MNEQVKEILNKFDKILENYELEKKWGELSVDSICHLFPNELIIIKDYITNLQNKYENQIHRYMNLKEQTTNLQEENERLKERCDYLQRSCDRKEEQRDDARMEYMEQEDYKSRCEKAIEFIKEEAGYYDDEIRSCSCDLLYSDCNKLIELLDGDNE